MSVRILPISTGQVRVKSSQILREFGGPWRVMGDPRWTDWLPIHAWLIDHPEGPILVDSGETCRVCGKGYFPRWHPYYRKSTDFAITADDEVGPALARLGLRVADVRKVLLTHLHTDHAGGLHHLRASTVYVSAEEWRIAQGVGGALRGYLAHHWPQDFRPRFYDFSGPAMGPFPRSCAITKAGDVIVVPTPGHTPGHVSVIVRTGGLSYFLAGDASYTQDALCAGRPDGVTLFPRTAVRTLARIVAYARIEPMVYLPAHDPRSAARLQTAAIFRCEAGPA